MPDRSRKKAKKFRKNIEAEHVVLQEKMPLSEMPGFQIKKLGPLCSKIGSGATPRGGNEVYLDQGEMVLIRSQNVRNEHFDENGLVFIEDKHAKQLANVTVERGDVLLNITGDSVARCCQVIPEVLPARVNQHVAIIRTIPELLEPRFLRYFLISPYMQNLMLGWAGAGATRNALTKEMIESFEVPVPTLPEQKAIAHILGSLDDKIELNRKMNETLEAMAQALFKSWFIDFDPVIDNAILARKSIPDEFAERAEKRRSILSGSSTSGRGGDEGLVKDYHSLFPDEFVFLSPAGRDKSEGAEHGREVGEGAKGLGWIPKGWRVGPLSELAELNPESWTAKNAPQHVQYVDLSNTKNGRINLIVPYEFSEAPSRARRILRQDDTIIGTVRPGNRSFAYIHEDGLTGSTGFAVMRGKEKYFRIFIYMCLTRTEVIDNFAHLADGAAYPAIRPEVVADFKCILPTEDLLKQFDTLAYPWIKCSGERESQVNSLSTLRDTLLPKLLSGEIRISKAEKILEDGK